MYKRIKIFGLLFLCAFTTLIAQNNTPTYTWRMHLPYNSVKDIIENQGLLYVLSDVGVYTFDLTSGEIETFTKVDGFVESAVSCIGFSESSNALVIAYKSGNIDIVKDKEIINIPGIKRSSIVGLKDIYEIKIYNNLAYLATSFGVVVLDLDKEEIIDDYQNLGLGGLSLAVNSVEVLNDSLFLGTKDGILVAPAFDQSVNLKNFASWQVRSTYDSAYHLTRYNGGLYFVQDSMLHKYIDGAYTLVESGIKDGYSSLKNSHNELVICRWSSIVVLNEQGDLTKRGEPFMDCAIKDYQGNLWFGGYYRGLIKINEAGGYSYVTPKGPFDANSYGMQGVGTKMYVTAGGHTSAYGPTYNDRGYYVYEDGNWLNNDKKDPFAGTMIDFTNMHIAQNTNEIWVGSFGEGLLQIRNGEPVAKYNSDNSTLSEAPGGRQVVLGMATDSKDNLWVANYEADKPLCVRRKDGTWEEFSTSVPRLGEMIVDEYDQIWCLAPRTSEIGIVVFRELESGGVQSRSLNTVKDRGALPGNNVNAIALDKDGKIWVGSQSGIAVFHNTIEVFKGGKYADAQQIVIDDGEDIGYLLGNEVVNDIKIDGANRKWVATNNGAWLIAEDGQSVLNHFTAENSPLPDNEVNCIGVVPSTGEVFFGTKEGIASFRGDATEAGDLHTNTLVFPNPVHANYDGPITITGLPENATVKITDIAGRVVYEMIANGGTAVWDGYSFSGDKPQTGVYLIFTANEEDEDALVSKLLIVR